MILRKLCRLFGIMLVVLSFFLLANELRKFGLDAVRLAFEPGLLALAVAASFGYAALLVLPAAAWSCALREEMDDSFVSRTAVIIYARCNILKYLPGNVFQFGGRQLMANKAGWSHKRILLATMLEIISLPFSALLVALFALYLSRLGVNIGLSVALLQFDLSPFAVAFALVGFAALVAGVLIFLKGLSAISLVTVVALQIVFFAASAALVGGIAMAMAGASLDDFPIIAAVYLASWIVGYVVPGAPGGIGLREAVFVHVAAITIPTPAALAIALLARIVTTLGDLWFTLYANVSELPNETIRTGG